MIKRIAFVLAVSAAILSGCATSKSHESTPVAMKCSMGKGDCCKDPKTCADCCKDAKGCADCCKKS